jgi:hypothetical protein
MEAKGTTLFAGGQIGTGVFRSTDLGANWTLLGGGLSSGSYRGFASNNQIIVAGSFGAGVFYSTDNGDTWTTINSGLTDLTIFDLEINDGYIVAATNTNGVFRFALSNLHLCPQDFDGDGEIATGDLSLILLNFGQVPAGEPTDLDQSGVVDSADVSVLLLDWGACP